jgi:hypothetical protein
MSENRILEESSNIEASQQPQTISIQPIQQEQVLEHFFEIVTIL